MYRPFIHNLRQKSRFCGAWRDWATFRILMRHNACILEVTKCCHTVSCTCLFDKCLHSCTWPGRGHHLPVVQLQTRHGNTARFGVTRIQTLVIPRTCVTSVDGKLRSGQYFLKRIVPTIRQISTNDKLLSNVGLRVVRTRLFGCRESCSC